MTSAGFLLAGLGLGFLAGQSKFTGDSRPPCFNPTVQEVGHFGIRAEQIDGVESPEQSGGRRVAGLPPELVGMLGGKGLKLVDVTAHLEPFGGEPARTERNTRLLSAAAELERYIEAVMPKKDFTHVGMHESYAADAATNTAITVEVSQPIC